MCQFLQVAVAADNQHDTCRFELFEDSYAVTAIMGSRPPMCVNFYKLPSLPTTNTTRAVSSCAGLCGYQHHRLLKHPGTNATQPPSFRFAALRRRKTATPQGKVRLPCLDLISWIMRVNSFSSRWFTQSRTGVYPDNIALIDT